MFAVIYKVKEFFFFFFLECAVGFFAVPGVLDH